MAVVPAYLVGYVLLDWLSFIDPVGPLGITPWNPPPGLSLFLLLRFGLRYAPWLFVAALLAELAVRGAPAPLAALAVAAAGIAAGYAGLALALRRFGFDARLARVRDATVLTAAVGTCTALVAIAYVSALALGGVLPHGTFARSLAQFWIGDVIGILVTTPVLLVATTRGPPPARSIHAAWPSVLALIAAIAIVFGTSVGEEPRIFYVLFLPVIFVAMRHGRRGTAWATLAIQVALIAGLRVEGHGAGEVLEFQFVMLTLALTALFLGIAVDERRAAEAALRDKQFELDRTLRAAATSELSSALAHELNQPLTAIGTYVRACQMLLDRRDDGGAELRATMEKVVAEAARAGAVLQHLREFFRSGTARLEPVAPGRLVAEVTKTVEARLQRHRIALSTSVDELPDVLVDRVQVETILHNLVVNAIEALNAARTESPAIVIDGARVGDDAVRIAVVDNGPGVPLDIARTLFDALATTKAQGMGLGLAISRSLAEANGGRLEFVPGERGAAFALTLPVA